MSQTFTQRQINSYQHPFGEVLVNSEDWVPNSDGSESRLGIELTLTRHFLADSYSILLEESRLGLNRARLFKTQTGSGSKGLTNDGSK